MQILFLQGDDIVYKDTSIEMFLDDLENSDVQMGGGSLIGYNLASVCSLICYIANLTIGKKRYIDVEDETKEILGRAQELKEYSLSLIDEDKKMLEEILATYKLRNENKEEYENVCLRAVDFSFETLEKSIEVLKLTKDISKIGNLMLASDFEISAYMSYSCVEASVTNIKINLLNIEDENYSEKMKNKYLNKLEDAYELKEEILKITNEKIK